MPSASRRLDRRAPRADAGEDLDTLFADAVSTPPGAAGLVFLPYLPGERAPIDDDRARGVFAGLSLIHGRGHLTRAALESGGFSTRQVAAPIRKQASASSDW